MLTAADASRLTIASFVSFIVFGLGARAQEPGPIFPAYDGWPSEEECDDRARAKYLQTRDAAVAKAELLTCAGDKSPTPSPSPVILPPVTAADQQSCTDAPYDPDSPDRPNTDCERSKASDANQ